MFSERYNLGFGIQQFLGGDAVADVSKDHSAYIFRASTYYCWNVRPWRSLKTSETTCPVTRVTFHFRHHTGCGRNSELVINKNNILLKVTDINFSTSQFTMVLNFFYMVSLVVYSVF